MEERKCFGCGGFGHMANHCRNIEKEEPALVSSNRFEVLKVRVMQRGEGSGKEMVKDRREILREEKAKRGGRSETNKDRRKGEKGEVVERSNGEDRVETGRRRRRSSDRGIVR